MSSNKLTKSWHGLFIIHGYREPSWVIIGRVLMEFREEGGGGGGGEKGSKCLPRPKKNMNILYRYYSFRYVLDHMLLNLYPHMWRS